MSKISNIASELAKKDMKFTDEDKKNQDRLAKLSETTKEYFEIVTDRINYIVASIKEKNPELANNENLREDILTYMENRVASKEITTIEHINAPEMVSKIEKNVSKDDNEYKKEVSDMLTNSLKTGSIVFSGYMVDQILSGNLTLEQLQNLEKTIETSAEVVSQVNESIENFLNGTNTKKDGEILIVRDNKRNEYLAKNRDKNTAKRGTIITLAQLAMIDGEYAKQKLMIRAAEYGLTELLDENGNFDMDKAFELFQEQIKYNPKLQERFSNKEKFIQEIEAMRDRRIQRKEKELLGNEVYREALRVCKPEDRARFMAERDAYAVTRTEIIKNYVQAVKENDKEKIQELDSSIPDYDKDEMHRIVSEISEKGKNKSNPIVDDELSR